MEEKLITTQLDPLGVYHITLARPHVHNALNSALIGQLISTLQGISRPTSLRAVVLQGAGRSFCAGADLAEMQASIQQSADENEGDIWQLQQLFQVLSDCPVPVVALAQGAIYGGGIGLLAVCDHVIAHPDWVFAFSEVQLGLIPAVISPYVVAKIGMSAARSLFLAGEKFDVATAYHYQLVHEVTADLAAGRQRYLQSLLAAGPQAVGAAKRLLKVLGGESNEKIATYTREQITLLRSGPEAQERMQALLAKRRR